MKALIIFSVLLLLLTGCSSQKQSQQSGSSRAACDLEILDPSIKPTVTNHHYDFKGYNGSVIQFSDIYEIKTALDYPELSDDEVNEQIYLPLEQKMKEMYSGFDKLTVNCQFMDQTITITTIFTNLTESDVAKLKETDLFPSEIYSEDGISFSKLFEYYEDNEYNCYSYGEVNS